MKLDDLLVILSILSYLYSIVLVSRIHWNSITKPMLVVLGILLVVLRAWSLLLDAAVIIAVLAVNDERVKFRDCVYLVLASAFGSLGSFFLIPLWLFNKSKYRLGVVFIISVLLFASIVIFKMVSWTMSEKAWTIEVYIVLLFIWGFTLMIQEFRSIKSYFGLQMVLTVVLLLVSLLTEDLSCLIGAYICISLINVKIFPRLIFLLLSIALLGILILSSLGFTDLVRLGYSFTTAIVITFIVGPLLSAFKGTGVITISGNSGTGKSTLAKSLSCALSVKTDLVEGDGDHKYERGHPKWSEVTHLNPKANFLHRQVNAMKRLKGGYGITRTEYDHSTGKFEWGKRYRNPVWSIFVGLHTNFLKSAMELEDLAIHLEVDECLKWNWKYIRDRDKRGYTREQVDGAIKSREKDKEMFIDTQGKNVDVKITYQGPNDIDYLNSENILPCVAYKFEVKQEIDICRLLDYNHVNYDYRENHIVFHIPSDFTFHLKNKWDSELNYFCGFARWEENSVLCQVLLWILLDRRKV